MPKMTISAIFDIKVKLNDKWRTERGPLQKNTAKNKRGKTIEESENDRS